MLMSSMNFYSKTLVLQKIKDIYNFFNETPVLNEKNCSEKKFQKNTNYDYCCVVSNYDPS